MDNSIKSKKINIGYIILFSFIALLFIWILFYIIFSLINPPHGRGPGYKVSRAKWELQSLSTALEVYFIDNNCYPSPDYDSQGHSVLPKVLTTPIAFVTSLFKDNFKYDGKGLYEYGVINKSILAFDGSTTNQSQWILSSYGPDKVDGNSGIPGGQPLIEEKAVTDELLGFPLQSSGHTYDPSNGSYSPGDIWRRGP